MCIKIKVLFVNIDFLIEKLLFHFRTGLGAAEQEITTNIVLLGDHKQLGPVINSDVAARLGLSETFASRWTDKF